MDNLICVLPDSVANQIAAGEVIQRPASVVKELVENSIDAGATHIDIILKDAGRNLIMVLDNGKGMSPSDAHIAFERHATSKLRQASDLFNLHTMGFRGEALASIASVAQVELITRRPQDELAWKVEIEGSSISNEEPTFAPQGSRITVRNLFFNVPARRKFLGDNSREMRFVKEEFIQIALVYPNLQFSLAHNDESLYQLMPTTLRQRIIAIFGKRSGGLLNKQLYPIDVDTQLVKITGFIGDPAASCHRDLMQYFFVNGRFIRHKLFRSAVLKTYETLIPAGQQPTYFLYFDVDPKSLDVNIHPTKTEVKFEYEQAIWPIIHASVREALGKSNAIPSIDFDQVDAPEIRVFTGDNDVKAPKVRFDPTYNPFKSPGPSSNNWNSLYNDFEKDKSKKEYINPEENLEGQKSLNDINWETKDALSKQGKTESLISDSDINVATNIQLFGSYMMLNTTRSILLIDQHRAHVLILYERYMHQLEIKKSVSQTLLFPEELKLDATQKEELLGMMDDLKGLGFQIDLIENNFFILAIPEDIGGVEPAVLVLDLIDSTFDVSSDISGDKRSRLALHLAKSAAVPYRQILGELERKDLVEKLFALSQQKYTPDGKKIFIQISEEELRKIF
jgi:DNA mismatch repair protein MutL